jgi:hypothetical protein
MLYRLDSQPIKPNKLIKDPSRTLFYDACLYTTHYLFIKRK